MRRDSPRAAARARGRSLKSSGSPSRPRGRSVRPSASLSTPGSGLGRPVAGDRISRRLGGCVGAIRQPLCAQSVQHQSVARPSGCDRGLRAVAHVRHAKTVRRGDQCEDRPRRGLSPRRADGGPRHGLGLPAAALPSGADRRRGLLGRRLRRQSSPLAAVLRDRLPGRDHRPDQPDRTRRNPAHSRRHHEPPERNHLQRKPCSGNSAPPTSSPA